MANLATHRWVLDNVTRQQLRRSPAIPWAYVGFAHPSAEALAAEALAAEATGA